MAGAVGAGLALFVSALGASAAPGAGDARAAQSRAGSGGGEFVVAFDPSQQDAATAAIHAAGGTLLDVTAEAGIALVSSSRDAFLDDVRADVAISGAARNHSVGTTRPGMPHRFADERPATADRAAAAARPTTKRHGKGRGEEPLADLSGTWT
jgi:hypothetical protein